MLIHFKGILCVTELQFVEIQSQESVSSRKHIWDSFWLVYANSYFIAPYLHIREMLITPKMIVCQHNKKNPNNSDQSHCKRVKKQIQFIKQKNEMWWGSEMSGGTHMYQKYPQNNNRNEKQISASNQFWIE